MKTKMFNVLGTKDVGIKVFMCPITNGLPTRMLQKTAKKLCDHHQQTLKEAYKQGERMVQFQCGPCAGQFPAELEIIGG